MNNINLITAYFGQQAELGVPPHIFSESFSVANLFPTNTPGINKKTPQQSLSVSRLPAATKTAQSSFTAAPFKPLTAVQLLGQQTTPAAQKPAAPLSGKRAILAELMYEVRTCMNCPLGKLRKHFVFGSGNADAQVMIIGEAPGAEEDIQGLPFVGAAGQLLTKMLSAIDLDRKQYVFISNIIKCRPPKNRTPESSEILSCMPIISRQIDIIAPKVILLLGKVAAQALLEKADSITHLRAVTHSYKGIPVFVTYHPAALLRNPGYRKPTWDDLQKLQQLLKETGTYDTTAANK